jgi:hypothetical protein
MIGYRCSPRSGSIASGKRDCLLQSRIKYTCKTADAAERLNELLEVRAVNPILGPGLTDSEFPRNQHACPCYCAHAEEFSSSYSHFCCPLSRKYMTRMDPLSLPQFSQVITIASLLNPEKKKYYFPVIMIDPLHDHAT